MPASFNFQSHTLITSQTTYLFTEIFHWIAILVVGCLGYMVLIQSQKKQRFAQRILFSFWYGSVSFCLVLQDYKGQTS
jgi:hypothetical protein